MAAPVRYTVSMPNPDNHLFHVRMEVDEASLPLRVAMPVWTPGSYTLREYARNVQSLVATAAGKPLPVVQLDKATWEVAGSAVQKVALEYDVSALNLGVQGAHLDRTHGYFNGAAVFLFVIGETGRPAEVEIRHPDGWRVSTGLPPGAKEGHYRADDYDHLIDCPVEIGTHRVLGFESMGVPHRIALYGRGNHSEERLARDIKAIVDAELAIFGSPPYDDYTFIIHLTDRRGGGLEHRNSTTLNVNRTCFQPQKDYETFLSLVAHEFFHTWNVKRIRPVTLGPFDYLKENYTRLLWAMEGLTSYYDRHVLVRAGLSKPEKYLEYLADEVKKLQDTPGRKMMNLEDSSFNAWVKHYRPDENSVNTAVSYYHKGELVGLLLDLEIRRASSGVRSLDDVFRILWDRFAVKGRGIGEQDIEAASTEALGHSTRTFFDMYVRGTDELDYNAALSAAGLELKATTEKPKDDDARPRPIGAKDEKTPRGYLGVKLKGEDGKALIESVLTGSAAEGAGLSPGDEILAVNDLRVTDKTLADRITEYAAGHAVEVRFFRRDELLGAKVVLGERPPDKYKIVKRKDADATAKAIYAQWLHEPFDKPKTKDEDEA
ncbi:MAG: M61 family metallopeptidase [Euryarchaeota archaeon]|nr:M61 family metallopeptidase [Euryarchaeota archaeon]